MRTTGVVREWHVEEGWGVLSSPKTPGGCWAHFSAVKGGGDLEPGQAVSFVFEVGEQDGYKHRALQVEAI